MKVRCGNAATGATGDVRSMWLYGLTGDELLEATACNRPRGHRGPHRHRPAVPPAPLRPVQVRR